jgi:hypothetical protein
MISSFASYLRKIAGVAKDDYHIEGIKIFFSAPKPSSPSSENLTLEKEKAKEANFQWVAYQILFSKPAKEEPVYYIYSVGLESDGRERLPDKVFESDSNWSGKNKNTPTKDMMSGDVKRTFPKILRGPNLHPDKFAQVVYVNTSDEDKGRSYSSKDFRKFFDNDFYIVLNPRTRDLKNPFGKLIGVRGAPEKEVKK